MLVLSHHDETSNETRSIQQNTLEKVLSTTGARIYFQALQVALSHGLQRSVKMDRLEIYMNSLVRR